MADRQRKRWLVAAVAALAIALANGPALAQQLATGIDVSATAGEPFDGAVATFVDSDHRPAGDFSAVIDWGDGGSSAGEIVEFTCPDLPDAGCYEVRGGHTYASGGEYTITTDIFGPGGSDSATSTATVAPAPEPTPSPTPTATPGGVTAAVALVKPQVGPGEPAIVDASGSGGDIVLFAFDLNGNGTYETKGPAPFASVVHTQPGSKRVGVQVTGADGSSATAAVTLAVAGAVVPPPAGQPALQQGTVVGSTHASLGAAAAEAAIKTYTCPVTVQVGVAEATMPAVWQGDPCFERQMPPAGRLDGSYPRFLATDQVIDMALLNGLQVVGGRMLISEGQKWIEVHSGSSPAKQVAVRVGRPPGYFGAFNPQWEFGRWDVSKPGVVATYPYRLTEPEFLGLPVVEKSTPVTFTAGLRAEFPLHVILPFSDFVLWPKNPVTGKPFVVRASNTDGIEVAGGYTYSFDLPLGIFDLEGAVTHSLEGSSHVWSGDIVLSIPSAPFEGMKGKLRIRDGEFEDATVSLPFKRPGVGPIGCCVYLVGIDGHLTTSWIEATATFAAGPDLIGDFRAAEVKGSVKWQFSPFLLSLKADELRIATFPVSATTQVSLTKSYFLAFSFWDSSFGPFSHKVNVEVRIGEPWYVAGGGSACFEVFIEGCAVVHGAAGSNGIAACGTVLEVLTGGIRVPWNPFDFSDYHAWWGCSFGQVKDKVGALAVAAIRARARAAQAAFGVRVPPGLRGALLAIRGSAGQPQVELRSPGGETIATPPPGQGTARGEGWFATRSTNDDTTYVVLSRPAGGRWTVREVAGSPPVESIGLARSLPSRFARGRVTGEGRRRTLHYRVARPAGTRVTFVEAGGDPALGDPERLVSQTLGRARRGSGKLRFTPSESKLRDRRIDAVVESQGSTIEVERVASFRAPAFRMPAAPRVKVRRAGRALRATWKALPGVESYQAFVNLSDGETRYFRRGARRRSIRAGGIGAATGATVEVRAVSPAGYIGASRVARLRPLPALRIARRQAPAKVLRRGATTARCASAGDGRCEVALLQGSRTLASGSRAVAYGQARSVRVRLTAAGRRALDRARRSGRELRALVVATVPGRGMPEARVRFR